MRAGLALGGAASVVLGIALAAPAVHARGGPFRKGPYLQNIGTTSITIVWEGERALPAEVEIVAPTHRPAVRVATDEIHEVTLERLEPGRRYRYAVTMDGTRVEGDFATAPPAGAPFSFIVFGDSRDSTGAHQRVVDRVRDEVPDFILATGDMVTEGSSDSDWQLFFETERELLRENALYPSLGNHDRQGRGRTADNFRKYFSLPENSPDPERYYAFSYSSARFLVLDSNAHSFALTDQTEWIEQQLQAARLDPSVRHIFVSMHHPPFSVSLHGGQEELREAWTPLFEKYQVAAVFSGHDHVYSRAEESGVRYFVSGGGGAPLYPRKAKSSRIDVEATQYFERVNHYLRVHVFGEFIEIAAVRADGSLIESISWGAQPRAGSLVARQSSGAAPAASAAQPSAAPAVPAVGAEARVETAAASAVPARSFGGSLGTLGILGIAACVVAAGVMVWILRR